MQKISAQSLLILALSILLALVVMATTTFAAFKDSKTVTGTITFNAEISMVCSGKTITDIITFTSGGAGQDWSIAIAQGAFTYDSQNDKFKLTTDAATALKAATIVVESTISQKLKLTGEISEISNAIELKRNGSTITAGSTSKVELTSTGAVTSFTSNLSSFITDIYLNGTQNITGNAFKISFTANFV